MCLSKTCQCHIAIFIMSAFFFALLLQCNGLWVGKLWFYLCSCFSLSYFESFFSFLLDFGVPSVSITHFAFQFFQLTTDSTPECLFFLLWSEPVIHSVLIHIGSSSSCLLSLTKRFYLNLFITNQICWCIAQSLQNYRTFINSILLSYII